MATSLMDTTGRRERTRIRRDVIASFGPLLLRDLGVLAVAKLLVVLHLLLQPFEAGRVSSQVLALVFDDGRLRIARVNFSCLDCRVSWRLSRARLDGVDARCDLACARASTA